MENEYPDALVEVVFTSVYELDVRVAWLNQETLLVPAALNLKNFWRAPPVRTWTRAAESVIPPAFQYVETKRFT
jgi:hypothetical protein